MSTWMTSNSMPHLLQVQVFRQAQLRLLSVLHRAMAVSLHHRQRVPPPLRAFSVDNLRLLSSAPMFMEHHLLNHYQPEISPKQLACLPTVCLIHPSQALPKTSMVRRLCLSLQQPLRPRPRYPSLLLLAMQLQVNFRRAQIRLLNPPFPD